MIVEVTKLIKHALKGKVKFSKSMVIMYMMTGLIMSSSIGVVQAETGVVVNTSTNNNIIITPDGTVGQSTEASTDGNQDVIIGYGSKSTTASTTGSSTSNTVIGVKARVSNGTNSTVIGSSANVSGTNSTVVGNSIAATGTQSTALGSLVTTTGSQSIAIGNDAIASAYGAIVIGSDDAGEKKDSNNKNTGANTLYATLRFDPVAKEIISLSESNQYKIARTTNFRKMVYENGTVVTKPREVGTNYIYLTKYNTVTGKYEAIPEGDPSMPASYKWQAVKGSAANKLADADGNAGWDVFGLYKYYKDQNPSLSDKEIESTINNFFSNPYQNATSAGVGSIAIGIKTQALSDGAIAQGVAAYAGGHESIAIGVGTTTVEEKSVAIGSLAQATGKRTVAIGSYSNEIDYSKTRYNSPHAVADDAVAIGTASYADYEKAVALGADAITTGDAGLLRATYDPNNLTNKFTYGTTTTAGATGVVNSATVGNVTYGNFAGAAGKGLVSIGSADNEKRLQNVAAGEITATSTDAINGSQLFIATKSLEQSKPFEYGTINPDGTSNPVEQGVDGKYYTRGSINVPGVSYDPATGTYVNDGDGTTVNPVDEGDIVIRAKGNDHEVVTNVKSNLPEVNNGNAGGTTTGFGGNADGITKNGDVITGVAAPTDEQVKSIANNAASVGDVLNAGWNLQNNGTAKDYVKPYDTVNFIDGVGTTAVVDTATDGLSSTVTFNVNKGELVVSNGETTNVDGDKVVKGALVNKGAADAQQALKTAQDELAAAQTAGDQHAIDAAQAKVDAADKAVKQAGDAVATVDNVVNAINTSGWKLTTSQSTGGTATGTSEELINPGETVTIDAGKNIAITQATNKITIATKDEVEFTKVTSTDAAGNKTVLGPTGTTTTDAAGNKNVSNVTGNTITDAAGNKNVSNATGNTITDAAGNTTNVTGDGITITGKKDNGTAKDSVSLTSNGLDNGNNKIRNVAAGTDATDAVNVSQLKDTVGEAVTNNPFEYTTKNGNPVTVGQDGNMYNPSDLADAKYDENTKTYTKPDGTTVTPIPKEDVVINAKGDDAQTITNVKSNLPEANNGNAGGTTTGFGGNADGITKNGDVITGVAAPTDEQVKSIANNAASVGDVLNAGWNLQNNGTAKDYVKPYDTVNFIDGVGTTAVVDTATDGLSSTVTFNVNKGELVASNGETTNVDGDKVVKGALVNKGAADAQQALKTAQDELAAAQTAGDQHAIDVAQAKVDAADKAVKQAGDAVATVDNVVNAINQSGWTMTTSKSAGDVSGTTAELINPGEIVTFDAGKNIAITQATNKITIATKDEVEFTKVTSTDAAGNTTVLSPTGTTTTDAAGNKNVSNATGNTITDAAGNTTNVTGDGITITGKKDNGTAKDSVSLTSNGLDNGNNKIRNVAAGTDPTDAVNVSQLKDTVGEAVTNNPFEYITKNGNPVTVGKDGNMYNPSDLADAKYDENTKTYTKPDGTTVTPIPKEDVVINAKGDNAQTITNVKSNLPEANKGNAGGTTTGFGGNADGITKNGDVITGVAAPTDEQVKSIANNAASVGDVLNAGWNLQNNGTAKDYVKPYDTVNFIDGVGTTAVVETSADGLSSTVTFNINKGKIGVSDGTITDGTFNGNGTASNPLANGSLVNADKADAFNDLKTAQDELAAATAAGDQHAIDAAQAKVDAANKAIQEAGDVLATVDNVVNAINQSGWTMTTSKSAGDVSGTTAELINPGEIVTFDAGSNITIKQNGNKITIATADNPFEYIVTETAADGSTTTSPVIKAPNGKVYKTDAIKNAVYNPDTQNYEVTTITPDGNKIVTVVDPVSDDVADTLTVNAKGDTPQTITNVKSNLPEANNGNAGGTTTGFGGNADGITKNGDAITSVTAPTEEQVKSMANNAASVGDVLNAGWNLQNNGTAKDYVKPYDTVNFIDGVGTKAVVKTADDGLSSTITFDANTGSMSATDGMAVNNNASNIENANKELANAKDVLATVKADPNATPDAIAKAEKDVMNKQAIVDGYTNQVATVQDVVNTINNTYWTATSGQAGSGVVESTTKESVKAGDEVTFKAGNNLKLVQDGKNFTYSLQDSISLTEVKTGNTVMNTSGLQVGDSLGNITKIGSNGITIGGNDRQSVSLTNTGLDNGGNRIINVAPGVENTDAVNVGQLRESNIQMNQQVNKLSNDMKHMGAKAAALSSLKTIQYDPLEPTQISAGVGYYSGASAMALGISHYKNESTLFSGGIAFGGSDGGKIMANASVTWKLGHRADETAVSDTYRNGPISSTYALQDTVKALTAENKAQKSALQGQQQEIDWQRNKIEELEAKLAKIMSQLGV